MCIRMSTCTKSSSVRWLNVGEPVRMCVCCVFLGEGVRGWMWMCGCVGVGACARVMWKWVMCVCVCADVPRVRVCVCCVCERE